MGIRFGGLVVSGALSLLLAGGANAIQPDAPFIEAQKRNASEWAAEDQQLDERLAALRQRFGKRPNIVYILADDVGWGELGWQGGGKHRGTPTPELDAMAAEGMRFWSAYAEPSCTPSRIAINTGRHPVRTGLLSVLWPGQTEGLSPDEVTVAEVLSKAGYDTAMWGKWHLGELPEQAPENQGYDYAYYGLFNGAPDAWPGCHAEYAERPSQSRCPFYDFPGAEEYKRLTGIDLSPAGYIGRRGKGREPIPGAAGVLGSDRQDAFEKESIAQITAFVKERAKSDRPFFIYWATYAQQTRCASRGSRRTRSSSGGATTARCTPSGRTPATAGCAAPRATSPRAASASRRWPGGPA
jgi:arylsulfatase